MAGSNGNLYLAAAVACMTASLLGYSVGFIGGILVLPSFMHHFGLDRLSSNDLAVAQAATVTSWLVGTLVGVAAAMPIYTKMGRKPCLLFCSVLYILGASLQISGVGGIAVFDVGRLLNGVGVGAGTLVSPLYIAEISTPDTRGMLMSGYQVGVQLSALVGFWGAYVSHKAFPDTSVQQYLVPVALQLIPGVLLILGTLYIVEVPRFLAEESQYETLNRSICWLRGLQESSPEVLSEVESIKRSVASVEHAQSLHKESFVAQLTSNPSLRRRYLWA
ncbi:putative quinate permease [Cyphellophora attinorum]|uniref:Quinate transporter n=1 Tax=Cyphellophora attinorum TaxID=1664694 RepID=A0A0N1HA79_9EURO|nr:putative quinate permease [Phialophora attinorum]KPI40820.1 putative quinate permease [Phialophora attinorum]